LSGSSVRPWYSSGRFVLGRYWPLHLTGQCHCPLPESTKLR
jgi:hypothetical protein